MLFQFLNKGTKYFQFSEDKPPDFFKVSIHGNDIHSITSLILSWNACYYFV